MSHSTTPSGTPSDPAPNPHASAEEVQAAYGDPKLANVLYHDWEAGTYDEKWSISYDERCISYATAVFEPVAGREGQPYPTAMELGSGTGFFLLNLMQGGVIKKGSVTDLSPGMVEVALRNAERLGLDVDGRVADAERIPYDDNSFDLVVGHAVLHHIPDVEAALREVLRVLKPGTFDPSELERMSSSAGAVDVKAVTDEFSAALAGWPIRTFEAAVPDEKLTLRWRLFAYKLWLRLSAVDKKLLSKVLPRELFYNVMVTGTKPPAPVEL
ncbi:methyltransferase type 11 [Streptomyces regensis]|nr:methyltransferase type 11 [Streptomyces regensis]